MQQLQQALQHVQQHGLGSLLTLLILAQQTGLAQLDIPVAEFRPSEIINARGGQAEVAILHMRGNVTNRILQASQNPLVRQLQASGINLLAAVHVHQHKAGSIPNLIGEVAGRFHLVLGEARIVSGTHAHHQGEAQRVRTILVDDLQGIHAIAQRLRHFPAQLVAHQAVDQHGLEGGLAHLLHTAGNHAGHPEGNDVVTRHQHIRGVEILQILGVIRPAQRGEGPQGRAEPRVQHILVLMDMRAAALGAHRRVFPAHHHLAAVVAVPHGNTVAPPQLTAHAPVTDVLHPVHVILGEPSGHKLGLAAGHSLNGRLRQRLHVHEPLLGHHGLNGGVAAIAGAHLVLEGFHFFQQSQRFHVRHDGLASLCGSHAGILTTVHHVRFVHRSLAGGKQLVRGRLIRRAGHVTVVGEHTHDGQIVPLTHLKVVGVMGRGDLHHAGSLGHVRVLVQHNRDFLIDKRQHHMAAMQVLIALVVGVNCHRRIAQHGFGTSRSQFQQLAGFLHRVQQVPEVAVHLLVLHFSVRDRGLAAGTPVHQPVSTIHQALFIQAAEGLAHRLRAALVHGKALTAPVAAHAHTALLMHNASAKVGFPLPRTLQERVTANHVFGQAFLGHGFDDLHLRGDSRMVGARQPQGRIALHTVIAHRSVLHSAVHGMTHVQLSRNVGRRHHDGEGLLAILTLGNERAALLPCLINIILNGLRIEFCFHIRARHFRFHAFLSFIQSDPAAAMRRSGRPHIRCP